MFPRHYLCPTEYDICFIGQLWVGGGQQMLPHSALILVYLHELVSTLGLIDETD